MTRARSTAGLTLIELILVMGLLATILAVASPSLGRFFAGRNMVEESRRVYALVRYGRNVAIERSVLAEVWFDPQTGRYGLTATASAGQANEQPIEWQLGEKLRFETDAPLDDQGRVVIRYWPDGTLDEESPEMIGVREESGQGLDLFRRADGFGYDLGEIEEEANKPLKRAS
ncbi:MAG: hypothetical protein ABFD69_12525 [Candidatus Sumerlaeia bacterium]